VKLTDPDALAALDANVDAMILAHDLGYLSRAEAFATLDSPKFVGLPDWDWEDPRNWENPSYRYSRQCLPESFAPWLNRIPRSQEYFWYGGDSHQCLGGTGYENYPPRATSILGYSICVTHDDLTFRFRGSSENPLNWAVVDPIPSMLCRAFFMRHCVWTNNHFYAFRSGTLLLGIDLTDCDYRGFTRYEPGPFPDVAKKMGEATHRYYESIGVPYGNEWYRSHFR
jgi:hypothetical protein